MKLTTTPLAPMPGPLFDAWLGHVREYRGWSQREVARRFGVTEATVRNWRDVGAPGYVGLACHALLKGMSPWRPPQPAVRPATVPDDRA